jgi:hypothetical protein
MQPAALPRELLWIAVIAGVAIGLAIGVTVQAFFLYTLTRTLREVAGPNRAIAPRTVWLSIVLNLLPIAGSVWEALVVARLGRSLRREFEDRGWLTDGEGFGRTPGLLWAWGGLAYFPVALLGPYFLVQGNLLAASITGVAELPIEGGLFVCFILYWVRMWQYGTRLRDSDVRPRTG